jgi:hypothetical protein
MKSLLRPSARLFSTGALLVLFAASSCSKQDPAPTSADLDTSSEHHTHQGPHNGTLVELGNHQFALEFVHDPAAGSLSIYVLDAPAENFIRLPDPSIELVLQRDGQPVTVQATAVANTATGETGGDTSHFEVTAEWLKTAQALELAVPAITIRGMAFQDIRAAIPPR